MDCYLPGDESSWASGTGGSWNVEGKGHSWFFKNICLEKEREEIEITIKEHFVKLCK